jgi:hypothetical protein
MHRKHNKSQAAFEFLTTYAWAFIVIMITIGALYYFGIFDIAQYLPQKCVFSSQLKCVDFALRPNQVILKLVNNLGEDIQVNTVQITNDANPPISCTAPAAFSWPRATEKELVFSSCSGGAYIPDSRVELKVTLTYFAINTPSQPLHVVNGKIDGKVTSS